MSDKRTRVLRQLSWMLAIWALSVGCFAATVYGFRGLMPGKPESAAGAAGGEAAKSQHSGRTPDTREARPAELKDVN